MEKALMAALIKARAMQLYYHYCHNLVTGKDFHSDHAFFAATYAAMELNYDALAEYFVALNGNKAFKTKQVSKLVQEELEGMSVESMSAEEMYKEALKMEAEYQTYLAATNKAAPLGLQNAVQGMATESDVRVYKIKQRLG
jgi:DNA-binding ferritin-like protein